MEESLMSVKIASICVMTACALVMVSVVPCVVSATIQTRKNSYTIAHTLTIDRAALKEILRNLDKHGHSLLTMNKVIDLLRTDFHIVIPGIVLRFLFWLAFWMKDIAVGPVLYILGSYLDFIVMIICGVLHELGVEIYWPYGHYDTS